MKDSTDKIKRFLVRDQFIITHHARLRMFQRNISTDMMAEVIANGQMIEEYPNDFPCPSLLVLGYHEEKPLHVVVAECEDHARIITVYIPNKDYWIDHKKRRRKNDR